MARWISLSTFKELYSKETDLLSREAHATFFTRLQSAEGNAIRQSNGIETQDFLSFVGSISAPEGIVFHGWVARSKELEETLKNQKVVEKFRDGQGVLNHTLASQFQSFLSPFLGPILLKNIPEEMKPLTNYFSMVRLLDVDTRATVEMQLFKPVREQLNVLSQSETVSSEQSLIDTVKPLCSGEFIESMNYLSKRSYALKMEYLDRIMEAIHTPACTVRFANWILKQMERLELNNEHKQKLHRLRRELAAGNLRVKKMESAKRNVRIRPILVTIFILAIIGAGAYLLVVKPYNKADVYHAYDSANADFSDEELAKIDSLSLEIDKESFMEGRIVDPNVVIQSASTISLRNQFKTSLMEQIFMDINKDVTLKENYYDDSCGARLDFKRYPGVKDLSARSASKTIQFRNDSEYDIVVYVTDNKVSGSVYSLLVSYGETKEFEMNVDDVLTTVAGKNWVAFIPPIGSFEEEKPTQNFRYHFCDTDNNYFESINTSLQLGYTSRDLIKFMVSGSSSGEYQLIDIYDVSEAY
jgi:hypothetical protein